MKLASIAILSLSTIFAEARDIADGKVDVAVFAPCAGELGQTVEGYCNMKISDRRNLRGSAGFFTIWKDCELEGDDGTKYKMRDGVQNYEDIELSLDSYEENGVEQADEFKIERTMHDVVILEEEESGTVVARGTKVTHFTIIDSGSSGDSVDEHLEKIDQIDIAWDEELDCVSLRDTPINSGAIAWSDQIDSDSSSRSRK